MSSNKPLQLMLLSIQFLQKNNQSSNSNYHSKLLASMCTLSLVLVDIYSQRMDKNDAMTTKDVQRYSETILNLKRDDKANL